jgi:hypothetical protein
MFLELLVALTVFLPAPPVEPVSRPVEPSALVCHAAPE